MLCFSTEIFFVRKNLIRRNIFDCMFAFANEEKGRKESLFC